VKKIIESIVFLNVLCLEDVLKDAELVNEMLLDAGYLVSMDIAKCEKEYVDFLKGSNYDVILADNSLPRMDAFSALKLAIALKPEIPFICVSGTIGEEKAVELLKQGASDYVLKERLGRLAFAVQRALKEKEMQKERNQAKEELKNMMDELIITNKALAFQIKEKGKREDELIILNTVLKHQISMRNQSDQALKESNEKYSKAFQSSPYSISITRMEDGKFIEVNDTFKSIFGFTREKALDKSAFGLNIWVNKEDRKWVTSTLLDGRDVSVKEFLFKKKNGEIITGLFSARIIYINKESCIISSINDITERKQTEKALLKLNMAINTSGEVIFITDKEGTITYINKEFTKMYGFTAEEVVGKATPRILNSGLYLKEDYGQFWHVLLNKQRHPTTQYINKCKNGKLIDIEGSADLIIDDKGEIIGFLGIQRDISERKQAELKLRGLTSIIENSLNEIYIFDTATLKFVYVNQGALRNLGFSGEEILALTPVDIKPEFTTDSFLLAIEPLLTGKKDILNFETIHQRKNGTTYPVDIYLQLSEFEGKQAYVAIILDITKRKQSESELIRAKEKAEESDRLKSAFLANMSHEIRTPMNGILGFADLLKEPNLSTDDQQDFIQTIQISGARMLNTINNIVDVSKIESGIINLAIDETNINKKIEFAYKFFKPEVERKGLQFIFKNGLPSKEANIKTDNEKVYGVLTNLVKNAIKFTYEGSIEFGYEKKGEYLEFYVKDTGVGIPKNQREFIFERFRQGSYDLNRLYGGSGLGLSISKSYVEMLGGKIWVESEEGLGSTFYFTIPYITASEEKSTIEKVVSAEHKEVQLKNLKILIVEDDEISYSLLSRTLQKISKEVLHVITGVKAVEACRNNPDLDLVLMDIRMPKMNGLEATRQIRQFNTDVIIIAQTAYAFTGDSEKAIEAGCNDYISKPINMTLLKELIKKHCDK